jgi:hypothetical protein
MILANFNVDVSIQYYEIEKNLKLHEQIQLKTTNFNTYDYKEFFDRSYLVKCTWNRY